MRTLAIASAFALASVVAGAAGAAHATVVVVPTLEEMSFASDVVAEVDVGDARVQKVNGRIVTLTSLHVTSAVKGAKAGDDLLIYQLGGALDGHNAWISGAHRFEKGEHVIIFAMKSMHSKDYGANTVVPYGIGFGLFHKVDGLTGPKVEEVVGDVVTAQGKVPAIRRYDSVDAFYAAVRAGMELQSVPQGPTKKMMVPKLPGVR